jgi:hypothetical protein
MAAATRSLAATASFAAGVAAGRLIAAEQLQLSRMAASPIAAPDAGGWIADFLNAAYYRRPAAERDVDDLRLAMCIVTTRWHRLGHRRLRASDFIAFHRAFGRHRRADVPGSPRGTLRRDQLMTGACRLLGPWFPAAYGDARRRRWGIAFETLADRRGYWPEERLRHVTLGAVTPGTAPPEHQTWHAYPAVATASCRGTIGALLHPESWPDHATEVGRLTPVRSGGLAGQTFEAEVIAGAEAGRPVFARGYATVTRVFSREEPEALRRWVGEINDGLARFGHQEAPAVPGDAEAAFGCELTTHEGHFMCCGRNQLLVYERDGVAYVRAAGTWDPLPWELARACDVAGREAQHAFWGEGDPAQSMLCQLVAAVG